MSLQRYVRVVGLVFSLRIAVRRSLVGVYVYVCIWVVVYVCLCVYVFLEVCEIVPRVSNLWCLAACS